MDILVIDRESLTNQLLTTRLSALGHAVTVETNKNVAFDLIRDKGFDCVLVDPSPMVEPRPVIIGIWKNIRSTVKPYVLLLSKTALPEDAILAGTNDILHKPLNVQDMELKMQNAARLLGICRHLAREDNVHSSGGMIGKAAFNQLFLSAIDRAFRYGERSLIVFISVANHDELQKDAGAEAVERMVQKLNEKMTFMRRQSDVIGRLSARDFAILLQRPQYESEPVDAINRFTEVLEKFAEGHEDRACAPRLTLQLIEVPQGALHAERYVPRQDETLENGQSQ